MNHKAMKTPGELGAFIRQWRKQHSVTLEELATRAGLSPNHLGTIERGNRDPRISSLWTLARAMNLSLRELLESEDPNISPAATEFAHLYDTAPLRLQSAIGSFLRMYFGPEDTFMASLPQPPA